MRHKLGKWIRAGFLIGTALACLPWMLFGSETSIARTQTWSLASPDGKCAITVSLGREGTLEYEARRDGKVVIHNSPLGLRRDDEEFERGLAFERASKTESRREKYELWAGTTPKVDHLLNHRSVAFRNANQVPIEIDLAAGNEGVAFRYSFAGSIGGLHVIKSELTGFALSKEARGWLQPYPVASDSTPAYEDFYFYVSPGEPPPRSRMKPVGWSFPALFHVADAGAWVLLTESGTDGGYCACHLGPDSAGGLYRIAFPFANETTKGRTNTFGPEPRHTLPWTMPWRVVVLGKSAGDIATAALVTDLAPPSRVVDPSWIRPGRASWSWWSYPEGGNTANRYNDFSDFAARMGWEYTLFDAGWWKPGLSSIASHARAKGLIPMAWSFASDFYDPKKRNAKLDEMAAAGVGGVKVDFWCSDRQETMAAMQSLFEDAASRRMVVNLHGCTIPRGWQRTWPNLLAVEAVLGGESYLFEAAYTRKAAELNTVLPFTRNAIGPMDFTPVPCSPKKYARTTTAAHELAAALIFTSGLIHYADNPEFFESLPPEALRVFRNAPARWDETRCLVGEPGRVAVFARRSDASWFIAGINGTGDPLPVVLDLSPFNKFRRRLLIAEGVDAMMQVTATALADAKQWRRDLPPRGGFIIRLDK